VRGGDGTAVLHWAQRQGLTLDDATRKALDGYTQGGWSFSLVSVTARDGEVAPVRLTFSSQLRVYPLLLSSSSDAPVSLRLYLPGEHRSDLAQHTRSARPPDAAIAVAWAGPTRGGPAASLAPYLTVLDVHLDDPSEQATTEVRIVDAAADDTVQPHRVVLRPVRLLGIPLGWLLVVWGGLGAAIGVVALAVRLRAR
jgi:hypothetical protein